MTIAFALDSGTIVRKMAAAAFEQGDATGLSVLLAEPDGKQLYVAAALGQNADSIQGKRVQVTSALSSWVASTEKLFSSPEERTSLQPIPPSITTDIASGVSIPMLAAGKLIGILNFSPRRPQHPVSLGRIKSLNILA